MNYPDELTRDITMTYIAKEDGEVFTDWLGTEFVPRSKGNDIWTPRIGPHNLIRIKSVFFPGPSPWITVEGYESSNRANIAFRPMLEDALGCRSLSSLAGLDVFVATGIMSEASESLQQDFLYYAQTYNTAEVRALYNDDSADSLMVMAQTLQKYLETVCHSIESSLPKHIADFRYRLDWTKSK